MPRVYLFNFSKREMVIREVKSKYSLSTWQELKTEIPSWSDMDRIARVLSGDCGDILSALTVAAGQISAEYTKNGKLQWVTSDDGQCVVRLSVDDFTAK
jgi:hypothetical protein